METITMNYLEHFWGDEVMKSAVSGRQSAVGSEW
jgi:hypothetical protein